MTASRLRAYSIASPAWHEELEFYSIKGGRPADLAPAEHQGGRPDADLPQADGHDLKQQFLDLGHFEGAIAQPGVLPREGVLET